MPLPDLPPGGTGGLPAGEYPAVKVGQRGQTLPSCHVSKTPLRLQAGCALLAGRGLKFHDQFSAYAPAVFQLDALRLGPLPDFGGIQPARRSPAPAAG